MSAAHSSSASTRALLSAAAVVVIVYGMQFAKPILVPFLVASFVAVVCSPGVRVLERFRVPRALAIVIVVTLMIGGLVLAGMFVGGSVSEFRMRAPFYEQRLNEELAGLASLFGQQQVTLEELLDSIQPGAVMEFVSSLLDGLRGLLANFFLIMFTVVFILLESSTFPDKLRNVLTSSRGDPEYFRRFTSSVQRYLGLKTLASLATGLAAGILTAALGLDFPMLWGLLAFLLNYVPNIGSFIAALPAVTLALLQYGLRAALLATLGYVVINVTIGSIIEPRLMGRGLGLSTLVVFLSLVFWGWVFGPVGMLLSVPLTMTAKIALESSERTAPLATLLGSGTSATKGAERGARRRP
jgi:AI-2 transport protein TqsA